jgi:hypothetical protein
MAQLICVLLQSYVTSSLLGPNIFLCALFLSTLRHVSKCERVTYTVAGM